MPEGVCTAAPFHTSSDSSFGLAREALDPRPATVVLVLPGSEKLVIKITPNICELPWSASLDSVTGIIGFPFGISKQRFLHDRISATIELSE